MENNNEWNCYETNPPVEGEEVICFNNDWICEDFNPKGIRIGFLNIDVFTTAYWMDYQDVYETCDESKPTHWKNLGDIPIY